VAQRNQAHRELKFRPLFDEVAAELGRANAHSEMAAAQCGRKVCAPADTEVVMARDCNRGIGIRAGWFGVGTESPGVVARRATP